MEHEKLVKLHTDLSAAAAGRGGAHGGLGFDGSSNAPQGDGKATAAGKQLLNDGGGKRGRREFEATTAGAVAAGHWDPWSRPIAFKMKQANRTVGGLSSMFVRGGVEGNTLVDKPANSGVEPAAAAAATTAGEGGSFNWRKAIKTQLKAAPGGALPEKALRKAVLAAYGAALGGAALGKEEAKALFKAKLPKSGASKGADKMVRLS